MVRPIISTLHTANGVTATLTTTKTQLGAAALILPAWAKQIVSVLPFAVTDVGNAAFSATQLCELESNDVNLMPFQVLPAPISALLGTVGCVSSGKPENYNVFARVGGGEQISVYGTNLVAPTTLTIYMGATLVLSSMPPRMKQHKAKTGTLTSGGTTATSDVAGTRYNFSSAQHIIELMGNYTPTTVDVSGGVGGYFKFTSNEFDGVADVKLPINPVCGSLGTSGAPYIDGASRLPVDIPVSPGQVNIQDYLYMGIAPPTTAGNFITGVIYE